MTATVSEPSIIAPSKAATVPRLFAENVLLVRLLASAKKPRTLKSIRKDLGGILASEPSTEQTHLWIDKLRSAGLLEPAPERKRQKYSNPSLTESGRAESMAFLRISTVPTQFDWQSIKIKYLVPRALGIDPSDKMTIKKLSDKDNLAAMLIRRRFQLPVGTGTTLTSVLESLVCQKLGFQNETTLKALKEATLTELLGAPMRLSGKQLKEQAPHVLLKTNKRGVAGLRELALREAAQRMDGIVPADAPEPFDLAAFAHTVQAAARACRTGWYGDNKVFINHVYRSIANEPAFSGMSTDDFKHRLVEANRDDLLTLSRADLVTTMNPDDVKASETHQLNAIFHFILVEKERPC